jgi:hypothetical protein
MPGIDPNGLLSALLRWVAELIFLSRKKREMR